MLQDVGWCWIKFENGQIFVAIFLDVARVWPAPSQHFTTGSNNVVARGSVEMLRAFGRALIEKGAILHAVDWSSQRP